MFLKVTKQPSGRVHLAITRGYRDAETKKTRHKTVRSLGYVDELISQYDDPIAHFKQVARDMTAAENEKKEERFFDLGKIDLNARMDTNEDSLRMLGFLPFSKIYHELEIDSFLINRQRSLAIDYSLNDVMQLLLYSRLLSPGSKRKDIQTKERLGRTFRCDGYDVYRALDYFETYRDVLLQSVHERVRMLYGRRTDFVFYDVTNYYFEIDQEDELRRKGRCKYNTRNPIVQMGLLLDTDAIPITYALYQGNTPDVSTLMPVMQTLRNQYGIGRVVVVADKGLNSGDNVAFLQVKEDGFIFSQKIRGANAEFQQYVFDPSGYKTVREPKNLSILDEQESEKQLRSTRKGLPQVEAALEKLEPEVFRYKSRVYPQEFMVTYADDKKRKIPIDVRQIVYYSPSYAKLQRHRRAEVLAKAKQLINNPSLYNRSEHFGAKRFVKNLQIDKRTGEYLETKNKPVLDIEAILEDAKYDGYYALITSEDKMKPLDVVDHYHGLWQIERSFRSSKSQLQTRPVHLSREQRIQAHFLTCFLSLLMLRLLTKKLKNQYSPEQILEELRKMNGIHLKENLLQQIYRSPILDDIGEAVELDFSRRYLTYGELRSMVADTKK